ncbi:cellulose binding domain-containing protein [Actinomadura hibisca]|uniref:cellulose binding domain-containing protein n=1 Tax=Actinomadura hibisca TaxID=68565 RepID=UPI000AD099CB|nr:cellulose binding domain-containing protein [Actinomadura hibisca]
MNETAERGPDPSRPRGGRRRRPKQSWGERLERRPVVLAMVGGGVLVCGVTAFTLQAGGGAGAAPFQGPGYKVPGCADECADAGPAARSADPTREVAVPPREINPAGSSRPSTTASPSPSASSSASPTPGPSGSPSATPSHGRGRDDGDRRGGGRGGRPPSSGGGGSGLVALYSTGNTWDSGYIGAVTVVNRGSSSISGWQLTAYFSRTEITAAWSNRGSVYSTHGGNRLGGSGGTLAPGDSVTVGFQASGRPGAPSSCTLNGRPCGG